VGDLVVSGLSVRYGAHRAVSDVSFRVDAGELVGLIGANGAGKTTTLDAVSGFVDHDGTVTLGGVDLTGVAPHRRARAGLGRTWQGVELFDDLTLRQNCSVAARPVGWTNLARDVVGRRRDPVSDERVDAGLAAVGLLDVADRRPGELPHGHQKLAGVARALAGSPQVLLLDEPAAGLDRAESAAFGTTLRRLVDDLGTATLLIDHDTRLIFDVCDRVVVLDFGAVVATGPAAEVRSDPRVIEAYLGVST